MLNQSPLKRGNVSEFRPCDQSAKFVNETVSNLEGCCPICGGAARRSRIRSAIGSKEIYTCPIHGRVEYGKYYFSLMGDAATLAGSGATGF